MKNIIDLIVLSLFITLGLWYTINKLVYPIFFKGYGTTKMRHTFINAFGDNIEISKELNEIIAETIIKKTKWYRNFGYGYIHLLFALEPKNEFESWITSIRNHCMQHRYNFDFSIDFTMMIIRNNKKALFEKNQKEFTELLACKVFFSSRRKKIKPKVEIVKNYLFVWFNDILNAESLRLLKEWTIEQEFAIDNIRPDKFVTQKAQGRKKNQSTEFDD